MSRTFKQDRWAQMPGSGIRGRFSDQSDGSLSDPICGVGPV